MTEKTVRLGVDIGGTFTDLVLENGPDRHTLKVLTTSAAPDDAILDGVAEITARAGCTPADIGLLIHGTTLATNALIERRGARTALVTTEGFRDVIEMRTESRFEQYDLNLKIPEPLIPRDDRHTVPERIGASGQVLRPLDEEAADALGVRLAKIGYRSVAVGLIHSYLNDSHEHRLAEILTHHLPDADISLSSDVSPQMREYERFNTVAANAYVKPLMRDYLLRLRDRLAGIGCTAPVYLMHSGGGIVDLETAARFPVRLVESGPAGGAIFAAEIAARHGLDRTLSFDMGGTTAKICLIRDALPKTARVFEVARTYRFKKGSGMPISIPVIEMVEIGAGGGSLAHVDAMRQIRVGPESAGSDPGPAAYGRGGARPAVTDADLVLGRLDPDNFAGGALSLDTAAAETALGTAVGAPLGLDGPGAAWGVAEVVDETMANAARVHAVENGEDLAAYTMIAFGGAAPLHAGRLAQKLGVDRFLVPPGAGVGSAIGFLRAPVSFEATRSVYTRLSAYQEGSVAGVLDALVAEATAFVRACAPDAPLVTELRGYMRYVGQGWEIPVDLPEVAAPGPETLSTRFAESYARLFGRIVDGVDVEITSWSVRVATVVPPPDPVPSAPDGAALSGPIRSLFDPVAGAFGDAMTVARETMTPGDTVAGPALITEDETTVIVPAGFTARALGDGCIDVRKAP